ncbi:hypothetical protein CBS101457_001627 [Exobasidium rhododendri]|nr:hypothetical protein CBS101457_001627 [Exobasidium rhododendri]
MHWYLLPQAAIDAIVPETSPLRDPLLAIYYAASILILHTTFHVLSHTIYKGAEPKKLKQRCWILTTVNGGVMTLVSIPYLVDLLGSGFDLHAVRARTAWLAHPMSCFFIAYLTSDLGLGAIYYRKLINVSSGWIHHTVYTFLFLYWLHRGWSHIAVMACIFELPTFTMGIASLHPPFRSNSLFTGTFFLTRVFFHFGLLVAACTQHGRSTPGIDGSWGPCISVIATYPMHLWWGYKCVMSIRRRMHKRKQEGRKQREAQFPSISSEETSASYFANSAAQLFNGFPDPNIASALNTPATTPRSSPLLSATTDKNAISAAFQRAAAFAEEPINLVLGRSRKSSALSETSTEEKQGLPSLTATTDRQFFSNAVRPLEAGPDDREPFLAIRSPAEGRDRARRLVADAIRKAWASAPESWRQQFEAEMEAQNLNTRTLARRSSGDSNSTSGEEEEFDLDEGMITVEKSRTQRGKDAARRAFFRAIHRAINGKEDEVLDVKVIGEGQNSVQMIDRENKESAKNERRIFQTILKLSGLNLPPDLIGQDYIVREFPVERGEDGRGKRIVGQIRRRMEINRRDVVVFD